MSLRNTLIFLFCFGVLALLGCPGYAQDSANEKSGVSSLSPTTAPQACINNFNIENIDLFDPRLKGYLPYLKEYVMCRSGQEGDLSQLDLVFANKPMYNKCKRYFNSLHGFFGRVLLANSVTSAALAVCTAKGVGYTEENCRAVGEGLLSGNSSRCGVFSSSKLQDECRSVVESRGKTSSSFYIKAIRSGRVNSCEQIPSTEGVWLCKGVLDKDPGVCEKNNGFEIFRRKYCQVMSK